MSTIQRTLIRDEGEHVTIQQNYYLGLVFVAFAAIPALVPFKSTAAGIGTAVTTTGALVCALGGIAYFLWRRKLEIDLRGGRCTYSRGLWPALRAAEGPLAHIREIRFDERKHKLGAPTFELSFVLEGIDGRFAFWESADRSEALDEQKQWRDRLAGPPPADRRRRAA